jgi:hypothetical protein
LIVAPGATRWLIKDFAQARRVFWHGPSVRFLEQKNFQDGAAGPAGPSTEPEPVVPGEIQQPLRCHQIRAISSTAHRVVPAIETGGISTSSRARSCWSVIVGASSASAITCRSTPELFDGGRETIEIQPRVDERLIAQSVRHDVHDHAWTLGEVPGVSVTPVVSPQYGHASSVVLITMVAGYALRGVSRHRCLPPWSRPSLTCRTCTGSPSSSRVACRVARPRLPAAAVLPRSPEPLPEHIE